MSTFFAAGPVLMTPAMSALSADSTPRRVEMLRALDAGRFAAGVVAN